MNQPQAAAASPAAPEQTEITVRIDIKVKMGATVATLAKLVESTAPLIESARKLGEVKSEAKFGRQSIPLS
jgi:hypothetical protein